jgi:hypothetical protein
MVMNMKSMVLCVVMLCSLERVQHFGGTYCLHFQGIRKNVGFYVKWECHSCKVSHFKQKNKTIINAEYFVSNYTIFTS